MGKALEKLGFAVTKAGHKYDAEENKADVKRIQKNLDNEKDYSKEHPLIGFSSGNSPVERFVKEVSRNRSAYKALKHMKGENSYNPFAGWSDSEYKKFKEAAKKK